MIHHKDRLESWHADRAGDKAPTHLRDKVFFHPKTGHMYKVEGHIFDAERGRWMVTYRRVKPMTGSTTGEDLFAEYADQTYAHLPEDFLREGRFLEVKL